MTGRHRVRRVLGGLDCGRPPQGELLFTRKFLENCGLGTLREAAAHFRSDIVTLPVFSTSDPEWKRWRTEGLFPMGSFSGPFSALIARHGWRQASRLIVKNEAEAGAFMGEYLEKGREKVEEAIDAGCEGVLVADDIAGGTGPLVSPRFLVQCYFPLLKAYLQSGTFGDVPFFFHSDGNILKLIPHVKSAGFKGIQGLQPSVGISPDCFDPQDYRGFVFWGNFEFEGDMRLKRIPELRKEVRSRLKSWEDFSYIFGSSGGIYEHLEHEAVKTVCDLVAAYGE